MEGKNWMKVDVRAILRVDNYLFQLTKSKFYDYTITWLDLF